MSKIKKVGVLGSGLMGSGIAEVAARSGYETVVREVTSELVEKGLDKIRGSLNKAVEQREAGGVGPRRGGRPPLRHGGPGERSPTATSSSRRSSRTWTRSGRPSAPSTRR